MKRNKKLNDPHILKQLKKLWLNETDAHIYLSSIHIWACSIGQLTTHTWINRITIHDSVWRLIKKWLLLETFSWKRRLIFPEQISKLHHLVDIKKSELDQLQHDVSTTVNLLQSLHLQSEYLPQVKISKGAQWITTMLREITAEQVWTLKIITDSRHFDELLNNHFLEQIKKKNNTLEMILPIGFEHFIFSAEAKGIRLKTKTLPAESSWTWWITIRWDKVALHAYEWVYITTTIIENTAIKKMIEAFFDSMRSINR